MAEQGLQPFLAEHGLQAAICTLVAPLSLAAAAGNAVVAAASATTLRVVTVFLIIKTSRDLSPDPIVAGKGLVYLTPSVANRPADTVPPLDRAARPATNQLILTRPQHVVTVAEEKFPKIIRIWRETGPNGGFARRIASE